MKTSKMIVAFLLVGSSLPALSQSVQYNQHTDKVNQCNWSSINNNIDSPERRKACQARPEYVLCMDAKMGSKVSVPDQIPDNDLREMISMCSLGTNTPTLNTGTQIQREEQLAATIKPLPDIQIRELPPIASNQYQERPLQANGPLSSQYIPIQPAQASQYKPQYTPQHDDPVATKKPQDQCLTAKVKRFRNSREAKEYEAQMGFEIPVMNDQLQEWKAECKAPKKPTRVIPIKAKPEFNEKKNDVYAKIEACIDNKVGKAQVSNATIQEFSVQCENKYNKPSIIDVPPPRKTVTDGTRNVEVKLNLKI